MSDIFSREELLIGHEGVSLLATKTVAVFGIGGVGSFAAEALARAGIGTLVLVDNDTVSVSNKNRQLIALDSTVGLAKTDVMRARIRDINPGANVVTHRLFFGAETLGEIDFTRLDYIVDAIDTVSSKLLLIEQAAAHRVPIISCMGTGNKLDPTRFEVTDIYKTSVCPLARVMRHELKKRGIESLDVVYSREEPKKTIRGAPESTPPETAATTRTKSVPGSISFVPPVAGFIAASVVVRALLGINQK